jgi:hypothetical protein
LSEPFSALAFLLHDKIKPGLRGRVFCILAKNNIAPPAFRCVASFPLRFHHSRRDNPVQGPTSLVDRR